MAFVPGPVTQQLQRIGIQLLLEPRTSAVVFKTASATVGTVYPVYASFQAVDDEPNTKQEEVMQWLTYWMVHGAFSLVEGYSDELLSWFPYYYHAKFLFLLWLQLPSTQGAKQVYMKGIRPVFRKYRPKIDVVLKWWFAQMSLLYAVYKVPLELLLATATTFGLGVQDFLKWFFTDANSKKGESSSVDKPKSS